MANPIGAITFANDHWFTYTGITDEPPEQWPDLIFDRTDRDDNVSDWNTGIETGEAFDLQTRVRRHDGELRWFLTRAVPVRRQDGNIFCWFGVSTDIDKLKRSEKRLRESEQRFRLFAEHSTAVIWILDAETFQIEYLNSAFERVWGEPREAMIRDHARWLETIHPEDRERAATAGQRVLDGEVFTHDYRIVRADGSVRWIHDTVFPIRDDEGRIVRVAGIAQDLTSEHAPIAYLVQPDGAWHEALTSRLQQAGYTVRSFPSSRSFLEIASVLVPGCVLLNADHGSLEVARELKAAELNLPVVVLAKRSGNVKAAVEAMKAGATDFLEAGDTEAVLVAVANALAEVRSISDRGSGADWVRARLAELSVRERQVLEGLLGGGTNKSIARGLGLSPRTIEVYRARVMDRLGTKTLTDMVQMVLAAGPRPQA